MALQSRKPGNVPEAAPFGTNGLLILRVPTQPSIHPVSKHPPHRQEQNKACAWGSVCWGDLLSLELVCRALSQAPPGHLGPLTETLRCPTPVRRAGGAERCVLGAHRHRALPLDLPTPPGPLASSASSPRPSPSPAVMQQSLHASDSPLNLRRGSRHESCPSGFSGLPPAAALT